MDGFTSFSNTVRVAFPDTEYKLCRDHTVRTSVKFVDLKTICRDLKNICTSLSEEEALLSLDDFGKARNDQYSLLRKSRKSHWDDLSEFFAYHGEIRTVIYTKAIASLNFSLRKITKTALYFPMAILFTTSESGPLV